jgi:hypothetical protein
MEQENQGQTDTAPVASTGYTASNETHRPSGTRTVPISRFCTNIASFVFNESISQLLQHVGQRISLALLNIITAPSREIRPAYLLLNITKFIDNNLAGKWFCDRALS